MAVQQQLGLEVGAQRGIRLGGRQRRPAAGDGRVGGAVLGVRDAVAAQPRRRGAAGAPGARTLAGARPASSARTGANVSPVTQPAQISSHSAALSVRSLIAVLGELAEEVRAAAGQRVQDRAVGVGEVDLGGRGQRQRRGIAACSAIQPSLPEIDPAPDQVTSPDASSSSSIAG